MTNNGFSLSFPVRVSFLNQSANQTIDLVPYASPSIDQILMFHRRCRLRADRSDPPRKLCCRESFKSVHRSARLSSNRTGHDLHAENPNPNIDIEVPLH